MIKISHFIKHETKKKVLIKFLLLLSILIAYLIFMTTKYGLKDGFLATTLTWSFFVFCTPIADAGFLLDFPIRLVTKVRMLYSEILVWLIATTINLLIIIFNPTAYETTKLLKTFYIILTTPYPFWTIIILSMIGTFLSIYFGDELIDVIKHNQREKFKKHFKKHILVMTSFVLLILIILIFYSQLLSSLNIDIVKFLQ